MPGLQQDFRLLIAAQFCAQGADGLAQAAFADVLVLEPLSQGTPTRILSLFALTLVPYSLVAPFLGVFVDRWPRRGLLVWTNLARGAALLSLSLWSRLAPGQFDLYACLLLVLGLGRLFLTTKGAVLPVVLGEHNLLRGNAVSGGGGMISALVGGVIGVGVAGLLGSEAAFAVSGAVYAAAAWIAAKVSAPLDHTNPPSSSMLSALKKVVNELIEGLKGISERAGAWLPLIGIFILRSIGMIVAIAAILVIKEQFPTEGERFGRLSSSALALGATGVGAFLGALTTPFMGKKLSKPSLVLVGFVVSGLGIIAVGGIFDLRAVLTLTFIAGFGGFVGKVAVDAQVQESLPDELRGRAFSLYDILYNLASVVAALVIVAGTGFSLRTLLVGSGTVTLGLAALLGAAMHTTGIFSRSHA